MTETVINASDVQPTQLISDFLINVSRQSFLDQQRKRGPDTHVTLGKVLSPRSQHRLRAEIDVAVFFTYILVEL